MSFDVTTFKSKMGQDGLRPNLFEVSITSSSDKSWDSTGLDFNFYCRAASIPGSTMGTVIVPYFGREVKFAGNRTFGDVSLTIINDENMEVRDAFEYWLWALSSNSGNNRRAAASNKSGAPKYFATTTIQPLSKFDGKELMSWHLNQSFPTDLSEITFDWGDNDSVAEFTVTMAYDYYDQTSAAA